MTIEHLSDRFPVFFGLVDAVRFHEGIDDVGDGDVLIVEHGELFVDKSLEISLDRGDDSLLSVEAQVIVLVGIHALECRHLDRQEARHVAGIISMRLLAQEGREDGVDVAAALEFDPFGGRIPVVVPQPLVQIGGDFKVDVVN